MAIIIDSSDPQPAAPAPEVKEQKQSAAQDENLEAETAEESDASEAKEGEELEAKDSDDQAEETEEREEPKAKKPGFVKRIDKLTKRLSAKEQELSYWREQALKGKPQEPTESKPIAKAEAEGRPKSDDFDTHEEYVEAVADWKVEQRFKAQEAKAKEESLKSDFQKQRESYVQKATAFAKETPDFEEVLSAADDVRLSVTVESAILKHGPELAYELAKDTEELERICTLSPLDAAEAIGEIRARIKSAKTEPKPEAKLTKAAKPPTPITGKSAPVHKSIYDDNLPFSEYERLRKQQLSAKR